MSLREVAPHFNIELVDLPETSCCGGPVRSISTVAATYLSIRNLAIAEKAGFENLLVPCSECHFMLADANHRLQFSQQTRSEVESLLKEENLQYPVNVKIWHPIDLFHDLITPEKIKSKVRKSLTGLTFAAHPGCQTIRPTEIGRVDHAENPQKVENLIKALGAQVKKYPEKLDCCGAALLYSHEETALSLAGAKLKSLQEQGFQGLVDTCPYCHIMYDAKQKEAISTVGGKNMIPVIYYTQLLGKALDIPNEKLGLHLNQSFTTKDLPF
jgi:heterodisulfide reductase subunit B